MAGQGAAPKLPEQRRNRHVPLRGEWVELPKVGVGAPPADKGWSVETRTAWSRWWADPASTQWSEADVEAVWELARLLEDGLVRHAAEIRLRTDALGLSQKGKRDMRWRVVEPEEPKVVVPAPARRRSLNVVA